MAKSESKLYIKCGRVRNTPSDFWILQVQHQDEQDGDNPCGTGATLSRALRALADDLDGNALRRYEDDIVLQFAAIPHGGLR